MPNEHKRSFHKIYSSVICAIFMILFLSILVSCGNKKGKDTEDIEDRDTSFRINAVTIRLQSVYQRIAIDGAVKAKKSANIIPDTSGILYSFLVEEGETVRKNQIIAQIDPSKPGKKFLLSPVKASISGIISSIYIQVGNPVNINSVIAEVANNSELEVELFVPERFANEVRVGGHGILSLIAFSNETFPLIIKTASTVLSSITHTMKISLDFEKQDPRLKSGMFGTVQLILKEIKNVPAVRIDYIVQRFQDGETYNGVFKIIQKDGKDIVTFQKIVLGAEDGSFYQVSEGLSEGDVIAVSGQESLVEGVEVTLLELDGVPVNRVGGKVTIDEGNKEESMQ